MSGFRSVYGFWVVLTILQPHLLPHAGDIPRSNFQFDFGLERKILAEAEKDNPNWSKFGLDNLPTKASDTSSSKVFFSWFRARISNFCFVTCVKWIFFLNCYAEVLTNCLLFYVWYIVFLYIDKSSTVSNSHGVKWNIFSRLLLQIPLWANI